MVNILIIFVLFYYFKTCSFNSNISELIIVISLFPTLAGILGFSQGVLFLYLFQFVLLGFLLFVKKYNLIIAGDLTFASGFSLLLLSLWFFCSGFYSKAFPGEYFNQKNLFFFTNIILPIGMLMVFNTTRKDVKLVMRFSVLTSCLISTLVIYGAYKYGLIRMMTNTWFDRQTINDVNPIWLGRYLGFGLLSVRFLFHQSIIQIVLMLLILTAIFLTGSKAALFFSLVVVVASLFITYDKQLNKSKARLKAIIMTSLILVAITSVISLLNEDAYTRRFSIESGTVDSREKAVGQLFRAQNNIIFGHGLATSGLFLNKNKTRMYPHNVLVEVWFEFGLVGLLLYLFSYFLVIMKFYRLKKLQLVNKEAMYLVYSIFLFFLFSLTSGDIYTNQYGIILSVYFLLKKKSFINGATFRESTR